MSFSTIANQAFAIAIHAVVINNLLRPQDFKRELAFYGVYHQDPVNQAIHFVFVPVILWTAMIWFAYIDLLEIKLSILGHRITWGTVTFLCYLIYYNLLDPFGGRIFSFVLLLMYVSASYFVNKELKSRAKVGDNAKAESGKGIAVWQAAGIVHLLSWYMQIHPGHAIFEGVKPALIDSLGQALTVAPLFAFYEGIWYAGFAKDLQVEVARLVAQERQNLCDAGEKFSFC